VIVCAKAVRCYCDATLTLLCFFNCVDTCSNLHHTTPPYSHSDPTLNLGLPPAVERLQDKLKKRRPLSQASADKAPGDGAANDPVQKKRKQQHRMAPQSLQKPGSKYKSLPYIRLSKSERKVHLMTGSAQDTDNTQSVKATDILEAAGSEEYCVTALCSLAYRTAPDWCSCPEKHPNRCKEHSFTHAEWKAVQDGPLSFRHS